MRAAALVSLGLAVGVVPGCTAVHPRTGPVTPTVPSVHEVQARLRRQVALCKAAYREGTHFLAKTKCDEAARRRVLLAAGNPDDLVGAYLADRASIAARLDRGEITRGQAELAVAKAGGEMSRAVLFRRRAAQGQAR